MNPQSQPEAGASPTSSPSTKQIPARVRVLLIDDDDEFRESLSLNLMDEGFAVATFANGPSALEHVAAGESPDVILLDWRMPGMNGFEVLRELRQRGIMTPVIFLTALSDDIYEEAALAGGAVDFIDKSRRLSILVRRIELIAEGQRPLPDPSQQQPPPQVRLGALELRFDINRAFWKGSAIDLTLTEFRMVSQLAIRSESGMVKLRCSASVSPSVSKGLTISAVSSSRAAPAKRDRIRTPGSSGS